MKTALVSLALLLALPAWAQEPATQVQTEAAPKYTIKSSKLGELLDNPATKAIGDALNYVGVFAVELFVGRKGELLVNEIAPRVHNTGHWTIEACQCSQFEQHIRAVAGWPLGDPTRHADAVMENIIGAEAHAWDSLAKSGALHLYGKKEARPGRKMGHVTRLKPKSS